ncbi:hypothetical protein [Marinactinospora rubrisoli]|uniref:Uncharacterized protein n=1 Tax=Marinactinospora rubrisoli TaxID=2715399 RepID=A0ABW2KM76_9ACTN
MHVLDDLAGFSDRARELLTRSAWRDPAAPGPVPTDLLRVPARHGRTVPAPTELVVRREAFRARYHGLRYEVRRSALAGRTRHDLVRRWEFDLDDGIWADRRGWYFSWTGERVSSPVRSLVHTDGRVGVSDGGPFAEVAPSVAHMIEGHALMDAVSSWDPWPGALEAWAPTAAGVALADRVEGLGVVPEASGRHDRWLWSDHVAVHEFRSWSSLRPRVRAVQMWTRGDEGRRRVEAALRG